MKNNRILKAIQLSIFMAVFFWTSMILATVSSEPVRTGYVSINVEIYGLEESATVLNQAIATLAATLNEVSKEPENLSVEQLQEINLLIQQADSLTESLKETLNEVAPTIGDVNLQATQLVSNAVEAARIKGIDPTVQAIRRSVTSWLMVLIIGVVVILVVLGFALYRSFKQFREVIEVAKSITDEYEIVRRDKSAETIA